MKTRTEVTLDRIGYYVQAMEAYAKEKELAVGDRVQKAGCLVRDGKVRRAGPELYEVESAVSKKDGKPIIYMVNGYCSCPDGKPDTHTRKTKAPMGLCKHRIAARMQLRIDQDLEKLRPIAHVHRYVCSEHHIPEIDCLELGCTDPIELPCPICAKAAPQLTSISEVIADMEALANRPDETPFEAEPTGSAIVGAGPEREEVPAVADEATEPPVSEELPPLVLQPAQYEPAPVVEPEELMPFLPEAAASLNIKLRMDQAEIMYTMRGHTDSDVLLRLPEVLATLEHLLKIEVDHDEPFLKRLLHAFFPKPSRYTGK